MRTKIKILLLTVTGFLFVETMANAQTCGTSQVTYSGYTSNYLPKWNATSGCISNSSIFDNGNVGIGATAPPTLLSIRQTTASHQIFSICRANSDVPAIYLGNQATTDNGIISSNGAGLLIGTSTSGTFTERVRLDYTTGNVGIGTTSPLAKLHLNNGSVLFDGTTGATPTSGLGARMMWIPSKVAFRAGDPNGAYWDDVNIGYYSTAFGLRTTASGQRSFAIGESTVASGYYSFATGNASIASGQSSSSFGNSTIASGDFSTALGLSTTSQSYSSFVAGRYNIISGTTTSWVATDPLFVIGNGSSTSVRSNALTVLKNGNVLINKTTQLNSLYKLDIAGTLRVDEIVVNLTGADFVFDNNYKLLPLKELELFIKENNHLPEIASAEEMETGDGVKIGEMQTQLLQKIEELTLYIIELNKKIETIETK